MTVRGRSTPRDAAVPAADERVAALLEAHAPDVLAYLQRRTDTVEDAADVLSDTLVAAWRRIDDLPQDDERSRMWLFATARNVLANHHRGRRRARDLAARLRDELTVQHRSAGAGVPDHVADAVRDAIDQLPTTQRELVTLVHWEGFTLSQAAEVIGIPASTARSRYASARAELAQRLTREPDGAQAEPPSCTGTVIPLHR